MSQLTGIIIGDILYDEPRTLIGRANGAHRIATLLRKRNIKVEVIDFFNSWTIEELERFIKNFGAINFIGLSIGLGKLDYTKTNTFIQLVKNTYPNVKVIAGGSTVTTSFFQSVDYYFRGFADGAIDEIFTYLTTGKINPFTVEHIKTHDVKKVIDCNKHYPALDLSGLKTEYTTNDFIQPTESLTIETSRGCVFKCKFCNFPLTGKKQNDYIREKNNIKAELLENYYRWGTTTYIITDDTFNDNYHKVEMMYDISKELPFKPNYVCYTRIDLLYSMQNSLEKMIDMGVRAMFFGIESLNTETSKEVRKLFTGEKLKNYLINIRKKYPDIHFTGSFIMGLPKESHTIMENNINWALENKVFDSILTYALTIPVDNFVNYLSPFSKEWNKHGYEKMTLDEISLFIENNEKFHHLKNVNYETMSKHIILWKNNQMNFIEAEYYAAQLRKKLENQVAVSAFGCFGMSYSGISLKELLKNNKNHLKWDLIKSEANLFVDNYKNKKLLLKF